MRKLPVYHADFEDWSADAAFPARPLPREAWRNGMLVRMPNHLGDAVMALPALPALKALLPRECGLFVIAPEAQRQLYAALPCVDGMVGFERPHAWWGGKVRREIFALRMGAAVLFNNSFRDALELRLARVPRLYGAAKRGRALLLTRAFRFPPRRCRELAKAHQTKRFLAMAAALGADVSRPAMPEFDLSRLLVDPTGTICALARHPLHLVLAAGAAYGGAKRWPEEDFAAVARCWVRHGGVVSTVGGANERAIGDAVLAGLPAERCFNLCGETNLNMLMVLLKNAALCVANDSGVMHLAAALGTPGLALFGPTDPAATAPVSDKWTLLYDRRPCAPCFRRECADRSCLKALTFATALRAMRELCRKYGAHPEHRRVVPASAANCGQTQSLHRDI